MNETKWVCPRCDVELGEVFGLTASCPTCSRAYTCITEEEREHIKKHRAKSKPTHGAPLKGYKEPAKEAKEMETNPLDMVVYAAIVTHKEERQWRHLHSGRTGFFKSEKSCKRNTEAQWSPERYDIRYVKALIQWEDV